MPFLQELADVVTNVKTTVFEPTAYLLLSSRVIRNLHVFTHPGDTKIPHDNKPDAILIRTEIPVLDAVIWLRSFY